MCGLPALAEILNQIDNPRQQILAPGSTAGRKRTWGTLGPLSRAPKKYISKN